MSNAASLLQEPASSWRVSIPLLNMKTGNVVKYNQISTLQDKSSIFNLWFLPG